MKKISRRNFLKVTAAGAVGAATLSLTGCGGSKDNGTTSGSTATSGAESKGYNLAAVDSSKNTEVVLWHNRGGKAGELLEQTMIPKFNETVGKEMGITVTPVYQSSSDLISKVKALILAKDVDNLPETVDFNGPPGATFRRPTQIRVGEVADGGRQRHYGAPSAAQTLYDIYLGSHCLPCHRQIRYAVAL